MIKKIAILALLLPCFTFSVCAAEADSEDFYRKQYELSGAETLSDSLPKETREFLAENGIEPTNESALSSVSAENVFSHIFAFLKSGAKAPLAAGVSILGIILISAAVSGLRLKGSAGTAAICAAALSSAAVISAPMLSVISACISAMQGCAVFMTAFIPVFAAITAASGNTVSSASMSSLLLGASQAVTYIADFVVVPLIGGYAAISLAASVSPVISRSGIADGLKKLSFWIMSLTTTVFVGILGIQTAVGSASDTLSLKTAKFIIGTSVPVAGTALSEALGTVTASIGMLKSGVGIYGVIACCAIFLPLAAELLIWRIVLNLTACASDLLSLEKISALLRCADTVMSVINGIIMLTCAMFVISLGIVLKN